MNRPHHPKMCSPEGSVTRRRIRPQLTPSTASRLVVRPTRRGTPTTATSTATTLASTTGGPAKLNIQIKLNPAETPVKNRTLVGCGEIVISHADTAEIART